MFHIPTYLEFIHIDDKLCSHSRIIDTQSSVVYLSLGVRPVVLVITAVCGPLADTTSDKYIFCSVYLGFGAYLHRYLQPPTILYYSLAPSLYFRV